MPINIVSLVMRLMRARNQFPDLGDLVERLKGVEPETPPLSQYKVGSVEWLQDSLNMLTGAGLVVDGDYGPMTKRAIEEYQGDEGLTVDGWAGPETINTIVADLEKLSAAG